MTRTYSVLYTPAGASNAPPLLFKCSASSPTEAKAKCVAAYPGCAVVVVR